MEGSTRRDFLAGLALGGLCLAGPASAKAGAAATNPQLSFVHPELRPFVGMLKQQGPAPSRATLPAMRNGMKGMFPPPLPSPAYRKQAIKGPSGAPDLIVYVINARPGTARPAILHTHGGGFILGDVASNLHFLQQTAAALDCVIVSVEYRLAPETTYEGSIEDNYAALKWLHANAASLGADPRRIAVMGESAGGGHAALLAITARDRGEVPLVFQALVYPMLDDRTGSTKRVEPPTGTILWTEESNRFGWESFLGQAPGTGTVPVRAVPARQADLKGLPPAFIGVGSIDLFVDEDIDYARRLIDSGTPAELLVIPGAYHGFDLVGAQTAVGKRFTEAKLAALRQAFEQS
ncbi:alpha/beta hydrolase [Sphingobium sp. Sx8-8]|uniref:alpha/beta hydrolase n=1 Tax=Sphingobium sp. Sx8-8 TaxID=2933617 RepID=UPI001F58E013|nr:alpha/beta hydrolase [Sphingobium sp. Sx8-8]